jgi:ELWxxDGT repeat protein
MSGLRGRARRTTVCGLLLASSIALVVATGAGGAPGDATATQVADIRPGPFDSSPQSLFNAGGTLLFRADDGTHGIELWKSNGGPLGPGGTELAADISGSGSSDPQDFAEVNGTVFFVANDGIHGFELWKVAPPFTAPIMVEDINPTTSGVLPPAHLTNVNGTLFFAATDGTTGAELWKSVAPYDDGSTDIVKNINTNPSTGSSPGQLINVNDTLFFNADDGTGDELWKSEPPNYNDTSTSKIDVNPSGASFPGPFANVNGTLLFGADDGSADGFEPFKVAPPYTAATQVENINPSGDSDVAQLINLNGTLFFRANDGSGLSQHGGELWKSVAPFDAANTNLIDINPGPPSSGPTALANVGGTLFFRADDGINGAELWKSNGGPLGPGGTELVANINPGSVGSFPSRITDVNGIAFFSAEEPANGQELWKSNGVGATRVADIFSGDSGSAPNELTNVGGTLFLAATDSGVTGRELWKATIEGPAQVIPPAPAPTTTVPGFDLKAAIKRCKKKFPKGKKRKKCIKKAKRKAG